MATFPPPHLLPLLALLLPLGACRTAGTGGPPAPPADRLQVTTTVLPITLFTRAVAGDCAEVTPLLPGSGDVHDRQARPSELARLHRSDVLVINGLGLESHLDKLISASGRDGLRVIDASAGLSGLAAAETSGPADHGHRHGAVNPHVWLDPQRASRQVETIRDGLIAADPRCRTAYTANAGAFLGQLRQLDADLARRLAPHAGRGFVAFHDTAPYFAQRYRLVAHALVEVPQESPSPADLQRVSRLVRQEGLRVLLAEPGVPDRVFTSLADDLGVAVAVFDPLETAPAGVEADPDHYTATLRRNGEALAAAFGDGTPPR